MLCFPKLISSFPGANPRLPEHKNADFVLERPENGGSRPQKRTKTPILCSKGLKTRVPKAKSAQKPQFRARKARKWGSQTPKAHKNADFVLEKPENGGTKLKKSTKMAFLCLGLTLGLRLGLRLQRSWFLGLVCR